MPHNSEAELVGVALFSEKKDLGKEIVPSFGCFTKLTKMPLEMHDESTHWY